MDLLKQLQTQNKNTPVSKGKNKGFIPKLEAQGVAYMTRKGDGKFQITNAYLLDKALLDALGYTGKTPAKRTEKGDEVRIQIHEGFANNLLSVLKDKKGNFDQAKLQALQDENHLFLQVESLK